MATIYCTSVFAMTSILNGPGWVLSTQIHTCEISCVTLQKRFQLLIVTLIFSVIKYWILNQNNILLEMQGSQLNTKVRTKSTFAPAFLFRVDNIPFSKDTPNCYDLCSEKGAAVQFSYKVKIHIFLTKLKYIFSHVLIKMQTFWSQWLNQSQWPFPMKFCEE